MQMQIQLATLVLALLAVCSCATRSATAAAVAAVSAFSSSVSDATADSVTHVDNTDLVYGLMIDAGSSGSRIYAYSWPRGDPSSVTPYPQGNGFVNRVKPGLSSFVGDDDALVAYLDSLIVPTLLQNWIPVNKRAETPIFLKATAGMRLLYVSDPDAASHIMQITRRYLANSSYKFDMDKGAKIIAGEQEAVCGWVAVNQALGAVFSTNRDLTAVSLDLGGASSQISFIPDVDPLLNIFELTLNNTLISLYAHSYLKFGLNQFRFRYLEQYHGSGKDKTDEEDDPCYPNDSSQSYVRPSDGKKVKFTGSGDFSTCRDRTKALMGLKTFCSASPCSIYGNYQSKIPDHRIILARDNFASVAQFFGVGGEQTISNVRKKAEKKCEDKKVSKDDAEKIGDNCLHAAYVYTLLVHGYGLPKTRVVYFQDNVGADDIGWQFGAMLIEAFRGV